MPVDAFELALLCVAALFAGGVDAIAGGGGLVTVPALLAAGLPPHLALGTNKGQSVFGASASLLRFWRAGLVDPRQAVRTFPAGFVGSLLGASLLLLVEPQVLRPLVIVLLVGVAIFMTFRRSPKPGAHATPALERHRPLVVVLLALVIGTYDGFFGPGTGTFLITGLVALLGIPLTRASADAKVVNFASNLAAVILFGSQGLVLWKIALPMAGAQFVGGFIGAHLTVKGGDALVRRMVLIVVAALIVKLLFDALSGS